MNPKSFLQTFGVHFYDTHLLLTVIITTGCDYFITLVAVLVPSL